MVKFCWAVSPSLLFHPPAWLPPVFLLASRSFLFSFHHPVLQAVATESRLLLLRSTMSSPTEDMVPPPLPDVWSENANVQVHYVVRHPWKWVMTNTANSHMTEVDSMVDLPSSIEAAKQIVEADSSEMTPSTPITRRRRQKRSKALFPATLKFEISDPETGNVDYAVHGTSAALDGLEDKDELVRTMQRCRCDHLFLSPPSVLINWDVSHEECTNVVGKELPKLEENTNTEVYAVLKEPMGSQGKGIYFVKNVEEIHEVIDDHRNRAQAEPDFLDNLIAKKGRIPSWGKFMFMCIEPYGIVTCYPMN